MSEQSDKAFDAWANKQGWIGPNEFDSSRRGAFDAWNAALASVAEPLELARRVKALPADWLIGLREAEPPFWSVWADAGDEVGDGETALQALRAAKIGEVE